MSKPRVVITGMGTVNPCGLDVDTTWDNLVNGRTRHRADHAVRPDAAQRENRRRGQGL